MCFFVPPVGCVKMTMKKKYERIRCQLQTWVISHFIYTHTAPLPQSSPKHIFPATSRTSEVSEVKNLPEVNCSVWSRHRRKSHTPEWETKMLLRRKKPELRAAAPSPLLATINVMTSEDKRSRRRFNLGEKNLDCYREPESAKIWLQMVHIVALSKKFSVLI